MIASANRLQVGDISSASDHCPLYFDLTTKPGSTFRLSLYSGDLSDILDHMASTSDDNLPVGGELTEEKIAGFLQSGVLAHINVKFLPLNALTIYYEN